MWWVLWAHTIQYNKTVLIRTGNYSADRHLHHDRYKTLNIRPRVGINIYSTNHRLFNHRFMCYLALIFEVAEGKKRILVAVCLDVRE